MTPKVDKAQLRKIAEELVGPLLAEQAREHRETLAKAVDATQEARKALEAERSRVAFWRLRAEAEAKDMRAMLRDFRAEIAAAKSASKARDAVQDRAAAALSQRLAEVDRRLAGLLSEQETVTEAKRQLLGEWLKLDAELKHTKVAGEEAIKAQSRTQQAAVSAASKHAVEVAANIRQELQRTESSVKSVAQGVIKRLEKAGG